MKRKAQPRTGKRIRNWILGLFVMAALLFVLLWNLRIDTVRVEGTSFYTQQEIIDYVFEKPAERNFLYAWLNEKFGDRKAIPFVAGYTLEFDGTREVTITVYEKTLVGYIEYMGSCMYFDKDGTIVESSSEVREGVPLITGLNFDYIVLYKPLPVADETTFTQILNLTQLIHKYDIQIDKIYFDARMNATLYSGNVRVQLGDNTDMEDKIAELTGMLPLLEGMSGTLHLEDYDGSALNPGYSFVKDAEVEAETETQLAEPVVETGETNP